MLRLNRPLPRLFALLVFAALFATGCASSGLEDRNEESSLPIAPMQAANLGLTPNWANSLGMPASQQLVSATRLGDLIITIERPRNVVSAVDVSNGSLRWRVIIGRPTEDLFKPIRHEDQIFVNSQTRVFVIAAGTGRLDRTDSLEFSVSSGPAQVDGIGIFGGINGRIYGHRLVSGRSIWAYKLNARIIAPPVSYQGNVFAGDANGEYAMVSGYEGNLLWGGRAFGSIATRPTVEGGLVYVPSRDQTLYALNRSNGEDAWTYRATAPLTESPVVLGNTCYLQVPGDGLVALDVNASENNLLWKRDTAPTPVTLHNNHLLAARNNSLQLIDTESGELRGEAESDTIFRVITGPDGSIVVITRTGEMLRLNPRL